MLLSPAFSSIVTTCARATLLHTTQGTWYSLSAVSQSTAPGVAVKLASGSMRAWASTSSALHLFVSPQSSVHMKVCWMARSGSMPAAAREVDERRARRGRVPGGRCVRECWARGGGARGRTHGKLHVIIVRRRQVVVLRHCSPRFLVKLIHAAQHRLVLEHRSDGLPTHKPRSSTDGLAAQRHHQEFGANFAERVAGHSEGAACLHGRDSEALLLHEVGLKQVVQVARA